MGNSNYDSYEKWISTATISKAFPHSILMLNDRHQVHLDFVKATDFLGAIFRAYKDLISADPVNCTTHLTNCDMDLDMVRKTLRGLKPMLFWTIISGQFQVYPLHYIQNVNLVRWHWSRIVPIILYHLQILK